MSPLHVCDTLWAEVCAVYLDLDKRERMYARRGTRAGGLAVATLLTCSGCFLERGGLATDIDAGTPSRPDAQVVDVDADGGHDAGGPPDAGRFVPPPGAPGAPSFEAVGTRSARVVWGAADGEVTAYQVELAHDDAGTPGAFEVVADAHPAPPFEAANLQPGRRYWFRVRALNDGGPGEYSEVADLETSTPTFVLAQQGMADTTDPTVTLEAVPQQGNLLVAFGFYRLDASSPDMPGWSMHVHTHFSTDTGDRRGLTVWSRVAGEEESRDVSLRWEPSRVCRLVVLELAAEASGDDDDDDDTGWELESIVSDNSGTGWVRELNLGSDRAFGEGPHVVLGVVGTRDNIGTSVVADGLDDVIVHSGQRSLAVAFGPLPASRVAMATMRWDSDRRATGALAVFRLVSD